MNRETVKKGDALAVRRAVFCERSGQIGDVEYIADDGVGLYFGPDEGCTVASDFGFYEWWELEPVGGERAKPDEQQSRSE